MVSVDIKRHYNSPFGLCGRKATLSSDPLSMVMEVSSGVLGAAQACTQTKWIQIIKTNNSFHLFTCRVCCRSSGNWCDFCGGMTFRSSSNTCIVGGDASLELFVCLLMSKNREDCFC